MRSAPSGAARGRSTRMKSSSSRKSIQRITALRRSCLAALLLSAAGCQSMYFGAMESLGFPERDLFVKRVVAARDSQKEAKEQFRSALEQFQSVVKVDGGDLEAKYRKLDGVLERSEGRAKDVRERIQAHQDVSDALF